MTRTSDAPRDVRSGARYRPRTVAYQPITEANQLPPAGQLFPENLRFDIKGLPPGLIVATDERLEDMACDMAAFANAHGGVILAGAHEQPRGTLHAYVDIDHARALEIVDLYQQARNLCSPKPVVDFRPIERAPGVYAVAVNVDAYAAPPIGVHMRSQGGDRPRWWSFPARRGTDNVPLRPEELATIMEPRFRRLALQLGRIPVADGDAHSKAHFHFAGEINGNLFQIVSIDADGGAVQLADKNGDCIIPIDFITGVRPHTPDRSYHVGIAARLTVYTDEAGRLRYRLY